MPDHARGRRHALKVLATLRLTALAGAARKADATDERGDGPGSAADAAPVGRGYLSADNPVEEWQYLDYSRGLDDPVVRERYLDCGASIGELDRRIDYDNVIRPAPNVKAINEAIRQAGRNERGGVVIPLATDVMEVDAVAVEMRDHVVYDGRNIGVHSIVGGRFAAAVTALDQQNFAIQHVRTDGNGDGCYGVRLEDSVNALVQFVRTSNHDQNSVATGLRSRDVTVRYCELDPGRDDRGNGTFRNQHGIVSSSFEGPEAPPPEGRAGIVYSHAHAWYSNIIRNCDGHSMDAHCSNFECMGNWTDDCRFGAKFPHSANVLVHHNRFGGARRKDPRDESVFVVRVYAARDYAVGVGYPGDQIYFFDNVFESNEGRQMRFDEVHGDVRLLDNDWGPTGDVRLRIVMAGQGDEGAEFTGRILHCGASDRLRPSISGADENPEAWSRERDPAICSADPDALVERMNAPKDERWHANLAHPLPRVRRAVPDG